MKHLDDVQTPLFELEVYECDCGYHIGLDATYLDQVGDTVVYCPSCKDQTIIRGFDDE